MVTPFNSEAFVFFLNLKASKLIELLPHKSTRQELTTNKIEP